MVSMAGIEPATFRPIRAGLYQLSYMDILSRVPTVTGIRNRRSCSVVAATQACLFSGAGGGIRTPAWVLATFRFSRPTPSTAWVHQHMAQRAGLEPAALFESTRFPSGPTTIITPLHVATGVRVELTTPVGVPVFETGRNSHFPFPPCII